MDTWIKHVNPTGGFFYVGPNNENRQDFNNDPLYPALKADIDSSAVTVVNWEDTQDYADAMSRDADTKERQWRNSELAKVDIEIRIAEDDSGAFNALTWRAYAKLLRAWPEHSDFPDSTKRPTSP